MIGCEASASWSGFGQPESGQVADERVDRLAEVARQADPAGRFEHAGHHGVGGQAADVLGEEAVATAYGQERLVGVPGGVAGDVDAGVAGADDQHPLAAELQPVLEGHRVADGRRGTGPAPGRVAGLGCQVTPGAQISPSYSRCARRRRAGPASGRPARGSARQDVGVERDPVVEPELAREGADVVADLLPVGIVRK